MWIVICPEKDYTEAFDSREEAFDAAEEHNDETGHYATVYRAVPV